MRERLAAIWRRAEGWLRREAYVRAVVAEVAKQAFLDGHKAGTELAFKNGYQIGRAHGELVGRQELAHELELSFNAENGRDLTAEDVKTVTARQIH